MHTSNFSLQVQGREKNIEVWTCSMRSVYNSKVASKYLLKEEAYELTMLCNWVLEVADSSGITLHQCRFGFT